VLLLALIAFAVPLGFSLRDRVDEEVRLQAREQADIVAATAAELLTTARRGDLRALVRSAARSSRGRVIVVDRSGRLIADSSGAAALGTSFAQRPEVAAALSGRRLQETRRSQTLGEDLLATATPVILGGRPTGAVRVTQSVAAVHRAVRRSIGGLVLIAGVVLLLGLVAGALIARKLAGPLRRLEGTARRIAHGDVDRRATVEGTTEQRSLARSFNEMTDRLSRALRSQREFVADASHQLRTPMTGLRLRVEEARAALTEDGDVDGAREELDAGLDEVDRLSNIVDELLLLSRAGAPDAPAGNIDLGAVASAAVDRWAAAAERRGVSLSAHADRAAVVRCARPDIDRALDSLVGNAVQYSPPGTSVLVRARGRAIEVIDEGPGLAPDELDAVFERFHRGRAGRGGPAGTGLGLPIARELLRRWDAVTTIENRPEGGARARIEFAPEEART
jgi:two-component system, OmpR family, sensor kinase